MEDLFAVFIFSPVIEPLKKAKLYYKANNTPLTSSYPNIVCPVSCPLINLSRLRNASESIIKYIDSVKLNANEPHDKQYLH